MSHNTWLHYIVRNSIVKPLAKTSVSPNQITTLRVITGVIAALFMASGPNWNSIGGGIFLVSVILDRVDGDLARFTDCTSPFGHRFDIISDALCNVLILLGLSIGLMGGDLGSWAILMGCVSGASVATILWMVMKMEEAKGARAAELPNFSGFDADDAVLLIPIFIWLGFAEDLLIISSIISPLVSIFFFRKYRQNLN
jgi:phosphatidylserine synthase|tara:strand:- start:268 stop:861 length:594 start_codon:yes stop_codon:yes gene_type:complete